MNLWADSHCHMADLRVQSCLSGWIDKAESLGIGYFLQGGVGPDDWDRQSELAKQFNDRIGLCFGLHPYWVADHSLSECEEAMDLLASRIDQAQALGETGLDFRPRITKDDESCKEKQISLFEMQLELSKVCHRPLVLHIVQAHDEALKILDLWGLPLQKGFVHSFNGSAQKAEEFLERGLLLSVGGPLVRADNQRLKQAVQIIPLEKLLIETDSPDQPPESFQGQLNPLSTLKEVAEEVARIKKVSTTEVLDISTRNLKQLLNLKEN